MKSQKKLLDYEFGSYTKTVKHIGQPGNSSVEEWQVEQLFRMSQGKNFQQLIFFKKMCVSLQYKYSGNITTYTTA